MKSPAFYHRKQDQYFASFSNGIISFPATSDLRSEHYLRNTDLEVDREPVRVGQLPRFYKFSSVIRASRILQRFTDLAPESISLCSGDGPAYYQVLSL